MDLNILANANEIADRAVFTRGDGLSEGLKAKSVLTLAFHGKENFYAFGLKLPTSNEIFSVIPQDIAAKILQDAIEKAIRSKGKSLVNHDEKEFEIPKDFFSAESICEQLAEDYSESKLPEKEELEQMWKENFVQTLGKILHDKGIHEAAQLELYVKFYRDYFFGLFSSKANKFEAKDWETVGKLKALTTSSSIVGLMNAREISVKNRKPRASKKTGVADIL